MAEGEVTHTRISNRRKMRLFPFPSLRFPNWLVVGIILSLAGENKADKLIVRTSKGLIQGLNQGQTLQFLGVPYATADRFQYPNTDIPSWSGVRNTTSVGPMCYQDCDVPLSSLYCLPDMSENCLTLNIFRPAYTPVSGDLFPVLFYIHGGDFLTGSGGAPVYNGDYFASRGHAIVVTLNYRLGAFGFLSLFDKYGDAAGNFGFRDQQAALAWVKVNIAAFKGDPEKITLMGDGPGCLSIVSHLASSTSQPMFNSAILQSCPFAIPYRTTSEAKAQASIFARVLGCSVDDVTCYRSRSARDVLRAQQLVRTESYSSNLLMTFYPWGPSIDDHEIFGHPMDVFRDLSRFEGKPIIIGTVADEGVSFVEKRFPLPLSREYYNNIVGSVNYKTTSPTPADGDMREALVTFLNDYVFSCSSLFVAKQIEKKQTQADRGGVRARLSPQKASKLWLYEFFTPTTLPVSLSDHQQQLTSSLWPSGVSNDSCAQRSCHGSDIRAIFNADALPLIERLKYEGLAKQMVRYWSNFARSDSVNGLIASRSHLRTLQIHSALLSDSQPFLSRLRPRSQMISFSSSGLPHVTTPTRIALQTALATFTYWPNYSTSNASGGDSDSTMLLQTLPLIVHRFHWPQCNPVTV